jgi:UV DNA damage endonuclease
MTIIRFGYVAMSMELENCSPSQTMTYSQFSRLSNRTAAIAKLERIATSNLENCLRLLKHNTAHDIHFFRLSSRLIPLANHEELLDWKYMRALTEPLGKIKAYLAKNPMRVDFHPDHFVLLNSLKVDTLNNSIKTLAMHVALLKGMGIEPEHRCVLHVGGAYEDKAKALEQFIHNWALVPNMIQSTVMLENDDTTFTLGDTLYLCEKLGIPLVFDLHHHLANPGEDEKWQTSWERVVKTWEYSSLPIKIHISSPKSEKEYRAHADYIDADTVESFCQQIKGSVDEVYCMIEAKRKDAALFQLVEELKKRKQFEQIDSSSFFIH